MHPRNKFSSLYVIVTDCIVYCWQWCLALCSESVMRLVFQLKVTWRCRNELFSVAALLKSTEPTAESDPSVEWLPCEDTKLSRTEQQTAHCIYIQKLMSVQLLLMAEKAWSTIDCPNAVLVNFLKKFKNCVWTSVAPLSCQHSFVIVRLVKWRRELEDNEMKIEQRFVERQPYHTLPETWKILWWCIPEGDSLVKKKMLKNWVETVGLHTLIKGIIQEVCCHGNHS